MERAVAEIKTDYVNVPEALARNGSDKQEVQPVAGEKLIRMVAVGFGLLCVLQVLVNVSLRLALYTPTSDLQTVCKNVTIEQYLLDGWVYLHPSFYYVSSIRKSWNESRKDCQQRDADLVIINTKEEQDFIRQFNRLTWIGLRDTTLTNQWTWVDGTPLTKSSSYWGPGEPNDNGGFSKEDCVETRFHEQENSWNDTPCRRLDFWICEKNVSLFIKQISRNLTLSL